MKSKTSLVCIILAVTIVTACSTKFLSYDGAVVTRKDQIVPLSDGNHQGVWKTDELAVNYRYRMASGNLEMSGIVKMLGGFQTGFGTIYRLSVQILFLDGNGVVVKDAPLYTSEANRAMDITPMNFGQVLHVPSGTTSFALTYSGILVDGSTDMTTFSIGSSPF